MIMRVIGGIMKKQALLSLPALLLLLVSDISFAQKSGKESDYPGPVAEWLAHAREQCAGGFHAGDAVQAVSLSGDGKPGYVIDPHHLICDLAPSLYGGALGQVSIELFATLPSGQLVHAGSVVALGYRVTPASDGRAPIISFDTHDVKERAGSVDSYRWDGRELTPVDRRSLALPPDDDISDDPQPK